MRQAFSVGEYLAEELEARGWTTRECAERMGGNVDVDHLTLDLHLAELASPPEHAINDATLHPDTAAGLSRAFGSSAELWMNLDRAYHEWRKNVRHKMQ